MKYARRKSNNKLTRKSNNKLTNSQAPGYIWIMHEVREEKVEENTKMRVFRLQKI